MTDEQKIKIKQPPLLFSKTQEYIRRLEEHLDAPILTYWNGPNGSVCGNDVVAFYELLERIGNCEKLYLFIKSDGGNGRASLRIINLIRQYAKHIISLVPLECASAATMMAIGTDEIRMGPMAYLSAVDTSLTHDLSPLDRDNTRVSVSLDELNRVVRLWKSNTDDSTTNPYKSLFEWVHPLVIGAVDRAESLSIMLCEELLSYHIQDESRVKKIANILNSKYPSHSYPIMRKEALDIGLNIKPMDKTVNDLLLEINGLYSEMGQRATTDFDEIRSHSNEILNILEVVGAQIFYQNDKDWFYRTEERRWITLNDNSNWRMVELINGKTRKSVLHIA
ncbi:hypothetical protein JW935_20630 [candidate division KSB1 bacterium]|nr:hypothetical protein [candidate division KSB1 bacterium]